MEQNKEDLTNVKALTNNQDLTNEEYIDEESFTNDYDEYAPNVDWIGRLDICVSIYLSVYLSVLHLSMCLTSIYVYKNSISMIPQFI